MERRLSPRYHLQLGVRIVAVDNDPVNISARTCNISRNGVLLHCSADLVVGQRIDYLIDLYPDRHLQVRCKGKVVRWVTIPSDSPENKLECALAVTMETYQCVREFPEFLFDQQAQEEAQMPVRAYI
jgi:hypothetical protein